jgi:hypothetical protein
MQRVATALTMKIHQSNDHVNHNYNYLKNKINETLHKTSPERMSQLRQNYNTTKDHCGCNETKLESAMLGIDIPCVHRVSMGAAFPECPTLKFELKEQWKKLEIEYNELDPHISVEAYDELKGEKYYAMNVIRRFAGNPDKEAVKKYIDERYNPTTNQFFISGKPVSLINVITEGIASFSKATTKK